jgi:prevent-host-death family protein
MKGGTRRRARRRVDRGAQSESVAAAEFKAKCLELMDRVRETGSEYVVTKHGVPVAKLVPYVPGKRQSFFGSMKGTVLKFDRPFDPIDGEYDIDRR